MKNCCSANALDENLHSVDCDKTYLEYHVFTNNRDEWFDHYEDALALFKEWSKEFGCARLYEEIRQKSDLPEQDGELLNENCLKSYGQWPY